jgi:hypothetical protein
MFFIDVKDATKSQELVCVDVISWFDERFLYEFNYDITVEHNELEEYAFVYVSGELEDSNEFVIEIEKSLSVEEYIKSLIHEMIHVEDYLKKNLTSGKNGTRYWKGLYYDPNDYKNQPWEIRASSLESHLFEEYCSTLSRVCQEV